MEIKVIKIAEAARAKRCSRMQIYRAIAAKKLNTQDVHGKQCIQNDAVFDAFTVQQKISKKESRPDNSDLASKLALLELKISAIEAEKLELAKRVETLEKAKPQPMQAAQPAPGTVAAKRTNKRTRLTLQQQIERAKEEYAKGVSWNKIRQKFNLDRAGIAKEVKEALGIM